MQESDIVFETPCGKFWVLCDKESNAYVVFENHLTHSESDSAFGMDDDGLSIAIYRAKYLAHRNQAKESI